MRHFRPTYLPFLLTKQSSKTNFPFFLNTLIKTPHHWDHTKTMKHHIYKYNKLRKVKSLSEKQRQKEPKQKDTTRRISPLGMRLWARILGMFGWQTRSGHLISQNHKTDVVTDNSVCNDTRGFYFWSAFRGEWYKIQELSNWPLIHTYKKKNQRR